MQFVAEIAGPALPFDAVDRKVVVLEQKQADVVALVQQLDLVGDMRGIAGAHDLARRGAVEHVDRAEGARPDATAARQDVRRAAPQKCPLYLRAVGIGQRVEIVDQRAQRRADDAAGVVAPRKPRDAAPLAAGAQHIGELQQRHLALEAHDTVELGDHLQGRLPAEAREMTANRQVAGDAALAQCAHELGKARQIELKDQRQADHERPLMPRRRQDLLALGVEVVDEHAVAEAAQCRRQVPQAEILLVLIANQHNRARRVARASARGRKILADQSVKGGHRALPRDRLSRLAPVPSRAARQSTARPAPARSRGSTARDPSVPPGAPRACRIQGSMPMPDRAGWGCESPNAMLREPGSGDVRPPLFASLCGRQSAERRVDSFLPRCFGTRPGARRT